MATKKEIIADIQKCFGKYGISQSQVAQYTGMSRSTAARELEKNHVPKYEMSNQKYTYLAMDVAEFILRRQL